MTAEPVYTGPTAIYVEEINFKEKEVLASARLKLGLLYKPIASWRFLCSCKLFPRNRQLRQLFSAFIKIQGSILFPYQRYLRFYHGM